MGFAELWVITQHILWFAVILFPALYLVDLIRKRLQPETKGKEMAVIFLMSCLMALAFYPFMATFVQYALYAEYGYSMDLLLFGSEAATYIVILLAIFLVYLLVYNKAKD